MCAPRTHGSDVSLSHWATRSMIQVALVKSCSWQSSSPEQRRGVWAVTPCSLAAGPSLCPWCFRTREWRLDLMWSGRGYSLTLASVKNEPVENQLRFHLLQQVKDQPHLSKRTSRGFFEVVGTMFLTKPALSAVLVLKGPKSMIPCERNPCESEHW